MNKGIVHKCKVEEKCIFKTYCIPYQCLLTNPLITDKEEVKNIIVNAKGKSVDARFRLLNSYFKKKQPPKVTGAQIIPWEDFINNLNSEPEPNFHY